METLVLNAKKREVVGKKVNKMRREGIIPAVLYGKEIKPASLSVDKKEFQKVYKEAGENALIDLKIDNEDLKKVLIADPQIDPVTSIPIHVDFHQVKLTEKVQADVPLSFMNEENSPAIKELEGTLIKDKDTIEVECFPQDIPHSIEVDVSRLKTFEDMIRVSDLSVPSNVKVLDEADEVVVTVMPPRSEEELQGLEEEVVEDVEKVEVEEKESGDEEGEEKGEASAKEEPSQEKPSE